MPATNETGRRASGTPLPAEPVPHTKGQVALPAPALPEYDRELYLPGGAPALGRVGDFVVESGLIAGGVAVIALLAFVFALQIYLPLSLILAVGVYLGVAMLLPARNPDRLVVDGLSASELRFILAEGRASLARIERELQFLITPGRARERVTGIVQTAARVLADFEERPRHVAQARFAFDALMDATVMAMSRYRKFWQAGGFVAQRGREVLEERVFPTIDRGFQQLLDKLLTDDLRTLNVDVVVLEQMLDLEGLAADDAPHGISTGAAKVETAKNQTVAGIDVGGSQNWSKRYDE